MSREGSTGSTRDFQVYCWTKKRATTKTDIFGYHEKHIFLRLWQFSHYSPSRTILLLQSLDGTSMAGKRRPRTTIYDVTPVTAAGRDRHWHCVSRDDSRRERGRRPVLSGPVLSCAVPCRAVPCRPIPSHPIPSGPDPSRSIPSRPVPSRPVPSRSVPSCSIPSRLVPSQRTVTEVPPSAPPASRWASHTAAAVHDTQCPLSGSALGRGGIPAVPATADQAGRARPPQR